MSGLASLLGIGGQSKSETTKPQADKITTEPSKRAELRSIQPNVLDFGLTSKSESLKQQVSKSTDKSE